MYKGWANFLLPDYAALSFYLENSEAWNFEDDFLYYFKNDLAVFSIELDSAKGLIHFQGNALLSDDDEKDLNELYNKSEDEVDAQNIHISREGDNLRINIPDPKVYDQFVTRLLNKNLMPDNNYKIDIAYKANENVEQKVNEKGALHLINHQIHLIYQLDKALKWL
ncbi:hypothetical protein [Legionella jamestowniensis]|uniref:Uncharacterized protein n=1 Tax=Legionella jamestowniensis TaxID=455 RepID=A0A0W0UNF5_9GAMM|nr:hypothetical protein [Legionella jamestowniensis]KTD09359.1 hypothetical protein Ljam_0709 [Legionella jamestowniensis]SFL88099.1 hypothetical protein SAMN02746073_2379 [Legionella jamestowniensis DSM 19215]